MRHKMIVFSLVVALLAPASAAGKAQPTIALPDEFRPEGIASGPGATFYAGSIPLGAVYSGSYRTGKGDILVPPHPGRNHIGLKYSGGQLFVAGGNSKAIYVYDASTGADVAAFALPDAGFVNDVVVTRDAAYFTDSLVPQLYRVEIGDDGEPQEPERIPLTGDLVYQTGFNLNGIASLGDELVSVQSNTGKLFAIDPETGDTREIAVDGPLTMGDGILRRGDTLYVVRNRINRIAVVDLPSGHVRKEIKHPRFDVPTTIAPFERFIYAVNARFDRPDDSEDDIVRVRAHR